MLDPPEKADVLDAVETHRDSSGHAPIAGVGEVEGEGDSRRKDGCCRSSCLVAIVWKYCRVAKRLCFLPMLRWLVFRSRQCNVPIRGSVEGSSAAGSNYFVCFAKDTVDVERWIPRMLRIDQAESCSRGFETRGRLSGGVNQTAERGRKLLERADAVNRIEQELLVV